MPVETCARPRPSRLSRRRISVSVVVRRKVALLISRCFSNSLALCKNQRAPCFRNCPARTRCASLPCGKTPRNGTPARLEASASSSIVAQINRRLRIGAVQQTVQPLGIGLQPLDVVHSHHARKQMATPKCSSVCFSSFRVRPVNSASSARFAHSPAGAATPASARATRCPRCHSRPNRISETARLTSAYSTFPPNDSPNRWSAANRRCNPTCVFHC